ncbi:methyltransferase [Candidatus Pelagibacter sp.]|nr:methyltransferase [Candidatus Pelagibacter sp.]
MTKYVKKQLKIFNDKFSIFLNKKIFEPNLTTMLLIDTARKIIKINDKVLDLGCGSGIIGCYLYKKKIIKYIYGSDLSKAAVNCSMYNSKKLTKNYDIRQSNLLSNWQDKKFDLIINDISGISSQINNISKWFKFAPNDSGDDGTKFTINILKDYKNKKFNNANVIFPVLGLSNRDKIISFLKKNRINYRILVKKEWPLPKDLVKHQSLLKKLKKEKKINYYEKFSILFTTTEIFYLNTQ